MNDQNYSVYHEEKEVVLIEGTEMYILGVDEQEIKCSDPSLEHLAGQTITVIHLFNTLQD